MTLEHLYTDTVAILSPTPGTSITGSVTETWVISSSGVSCEIQPVNQSYFLSQKGFVKTATHRGFFELNTAIVRGDRINMDNVHPPQLFDVVGVKEIRFHHLEVDLVEVSQADAAASGGVS